MFVKSEAYFILAFWNKLSEEWNQPIAFTTHINCGSINFDSVTFDPAFVKKDETRAYDNQLAKGQGSVLKILGFSLKPETI